MVTATPPRKKARPLITAALLIYALFLPVQAVEVIIPLTIPFDFLTAGMAKKLTPLPEETPVIRYRKGCNRLTLEHPQFGRRGSFVRFVSHGTGAAGLEIFGECLDPVYWRGYIEILLTPSVTADWQLHLNLEHSHLYDENWQKGVVMGPIWDAAQHLVLPSLTSFTVDLAPPRDEALSLLRTFIPRASLVQADAVFRSATAKATQVDDHGINVDLSLMLPENLPQQGIARAVPAAPLSPEELAAVQHGLEQWDAFLVFVVKDIGGKSVDPFIREQLFDLLLSSRYEVLPILAGETTVLTGDPVRALFIEAWNRLQEIIRSAEQKGIELNDTLRYAAFMRAGNVLLAIDRVAPEFGLEISADGLRRLARILQPDLKADPLVYDQEPDPELRRLFGLPASMPVEELPAPEEVNSSKDTLNKLIPFKVRPARHERNPQVAVGLSMTTLAAELVEGLNRTFPNSFLSIIGNVHAADLPQGEDLSQVKRQLSRWVPKASEYDEYKSLMDKLLISVADRNIQSPPIKNHHKPVFRNLVRATALKESCWRQFVLRNKKVTYLRSSLGSIGLMQINPRVWRGFYNLEQIKWNVHYNAVAGTEILSHYWLQYAAADGETHGSIDNIARAAYAIYNAGPGASDRYRKKSSSRREKKVDTGFWQIYQGFKANEDVDLSRCTVRSS